VRRRGGSKGQKERKGGRPERGREGFLTKAIFVVIPINNITEIITINARILKPFP
jgi:hypothetical protein